MAVPKTAALPLGDTPKPAKRVLKGVRLGMQQRLRKPGNPAQLTVPGSVAYLKGAVYKPALSEYS